MLYILGGASRSGKSLLAHRLLTEKHIPSIPIDYLKMGLYRGYPELGVNPNDKSEIVAEKIWPMLKGLMKTIVEVQQDFLIEGDALLPGLVSQFIDSVDKSKVRVCFVGYQSIAPEQKLNEIRKFKGYPNDWIQENSDEEILKHVKETIEFSKFIQKECEKCNISYFDVSDFKEGIEKVLNYLYKN
jgi:2-phosphoglycerate kinase